MPRQTKIKKGSIDLNSVFSSGYQVDIDGRLITGYKWEKFEPPLNPNDNSITTFQLPENPHVVDSVLLLYMFVNGVKVEPDYLSLDPQEQTILTYDDSDYPITSEDVIDIWYVPAQYAAVPQDPDAPELPGAAGLAGHVQINDGQDQITFAPLKWINNALIPDDDLVYDLGSPTRRWNDLYLNSNSIHLGNSVLTYNSIANNLELDGVALANRDQVSPQVLLQDQDFVTQLTGAPGAQGPVGPQGPTGLAGADGVDGAQGPVGPAGPQGLQGPQGDQGVQGAQGPQGPAGAQGPAGVGVTFQGDVPTVGDLPAQASQGDAYIVQADDSFHIHDGNSFVNGGSIQGPQGPQGVQGAQGPQGPQGIQGVAGAQGPAGANGSDGAQGPQGPAGASVTNISISNTTIAATLSDATSISGSVNINLTSLSDVDITDTAHTLSDGYVLTYDTTHNHWHPEPVSSTAANIALNDLSDVDSSNPLTSASLIWNGSDWVPSQTQIDLTGSGAYPTYGYGSQTVPYHLIFNINYAGSRADMILPTPIQANLGKFVEVRHYANAGLNNCFIFVGDYSAKFVDDGFLYNATTYNLPEYYAVKFKVVEVSSVYKYQVVYRKPLSLLDNNLLEQHDTRLVVSDTGSNGNINLTTNGTSRWDVTSAGHIIPATNSNYDIGNASNKVRHLFLSDNSLKFESGDVGVDNDGDITFAKTGEAAAKLSSQEGNLLTVKGSTTSGALKLNCEFNSHGVTIQGPAHSANATYTLTLPDNTGNADQVLKTDGNGALSWTNQASGGGGVAPYTSHVGALSASDWNGQNTTFLLVNVPSGVVATLPTQAEHLALLGSDIYNYRFVFSFIINGGQNNISLSIPSGVRAYGLQASRIDGPATFALEKYKRYTFVASSNRYWHLITDFSY